jgi:NAD(P)-dependent dehydrogenase (short-subunit alcohol dehydrogenase family)
VKALVTGGDGGIGRALRSLLEREGYEVESLDLRTGFDVTDPEAWQKVGAVDAAFLNAGVLAGDDEPGALDLDAYRRAVAVNVDGVVLGVRRLAQVMDGGTIVATASLAGLTAMPSDFVYSLTKHAVVGFVRSAAPRLGTIRLNAVCPGIADTPMIDGHRSAFEAAAFPLLEPTKVAHAAWSAATSGRTGECWFIQPGREAAPFRFPNVPGPRAGDERVGPPPSF